MTEYYIYLWLFAVFAREMFGVTLQAGLYSRVELTGENLDEETIHSLESVEWNNLNKSCICLLFFKQNCTSRLYSQCCGEAHFYLNNNSLILDNVTAQFEGVYIESIVNGTGNTKNVLQKNFTLHVVYPPNASGIVITWTSNTSVSLKCEVKGTFTDIMWKRKDSPIPEDNRHLFSEKNQTLHITNITSSDYGSYSCIAMNKYAKSSTRTIFTRDECSIHCENSTLYHENTNGKHQNHQILLSFGLIAFIAVLGLCINKIRHNLHRRTLDRKTRGHRGENDRSAEGGDVDVAVYQEIPASEEVIPLPYVYTDFIKPREPNQDSAAAEYIEDFGYSEIGPGAREQITVDGSSSEEQSRPCPNAEKE